jgi:hypothetical protein
MRKVLVILMGLVLGAFFVSCSEDSDTSPTPPQPGQLEITTTTLPDAYFCTPYKVMLQAQGGTAPYSWALAIGSDPLPDGLSIDSAGEISGVVDGPGQWNITVECTDDSDTPETVQQALTINGLEPSNPAMAIFFDDGATVCQTNTSAFQTLDCYIFIMTDEEEVTCARACDFMMRLTDADDVDYDFGTHFVINNLTHPSYVSVAMGSPFSGIAIAFDRPMVGPNPVHVATFGLMLMESLDELSVKFEPYPGGRLSVATCEQGFPAVDVNGHEAAINY